MLWYLEHRCLCRAQHSQSHCEAGWLPCLIGSVLNAAPVDLCVPSSVTVVLYVKRDAFTQELRQEPLGVGGQKPGGTAASPALASVLAHLPL